MDVTVLITQLNDMRILRTLEGLSRQTLMPEEIVVADGGSRPEVIAAMEDFATRVPNVRVLHCPGSVAESRALALPQVHGDAIAFIDADEIPPPSWLELLVQPLRTGRADVAGGPTRPLQPAATKAEAYVNDFDDWFYEHVVPSDPVMLPMGNSVWSRAVFDAIGNFDARLVWGGEDYDINLRAAQAGFRFEFVADGWVHHDQSHLDSARKIFRRKLRYGKGATMAYLKNGVLGERVGPAAGTSAAFKHPYEWAGLVLKPIALIQGWWAWRRARQQ